MGGLGSGNRYRFGTKDAVEEYCALHVRKLSREGMLDPRSYAEGAGLGLRSFAR